VSSQQARDHEIWNLIIIGDSRIIISAIIRSSKNQSAQLDNLLDKIRLLLRSFASYKLFHVLRDLNEGVDAEANRGALLAPGSLNLNGLLSTMEMP